MPKICEIDECAKPTHGRGLCINHYMNWSLSQANIFSPRCSVEECENPAISNGMCNTHYKRFRKRGGTELFIREPQHCSETNCERLYFGNGFCRNHYLAARRKADICSVAECVSQGIKSRNGMCKKHYTRFLVHGDVNLPVTHKKPKSSCSVEDCDDFAKVKGWCIYHYRRCYPPEIARLKKERNLRRDQRNKEWRERRAKKLSVPHEPYTAEIILQVHGTRCHLCGDEINLDAPRRSDMVGWEKGLHLDHVTPLAKGGSDLIINVKPAHGICNLRKGTKILNAQLG